LPHSVSIPKKRLILKENAGIATSMIITEASAIRKMPKINGTLRQTLLPTHNKAHPRLSRPKLSLQSTEKKNASFLIRKFI
jgi:hypothetical protein